MQNMVLTDQFNSEFSNEVLRYFDGAIYRERPSATHPLPFLIFLKC